MQHHADVTPPTQVVWKNKVWLKFFSLSVLSLHQISNSVNHYITMHHLHTSIQCTDLTDFNLKNTAEAKFGRIYILNPAVLFRLCDLVALIQ